MSGVFSNTMRRIRKGSTLPATCSPGECFLKTSGGSEGLYICITVDTWLLLDAAAGDGTVTSVSVAPANGLAGSVANPTTTPAITLSTSITGVLKGDGTAISAAAAGTDYLAPTGDGSSLTGLTKSQVGLGNVDNTSDATKNAAAVTLTNKTLTAPVINSPTGIVKGDVGLGNVDNTADAAKPVSTAQQTALDLKAPLASPTFTGTVTIPTPFTLGAVPVTATGTELNFVDGVTSAIQTQLDGKQATITFGTGVQTALGVNVGSAGAPVVNGGALGTPSSGTLTNATGLPVSGLVDTSVKVYLTANQSIPGATLTAIQWNAEEWDTAAAHDNVTNNTRLTFPATGKYVVYGVVRFATSGTGYREVGIVRNGGAGTGQALIRLGSYSLEDFVAPFSFEISVTAADYIELKVLQTSGGSLDVVGTAGQSHFGFRRVA